MAEVDDGFRETVGFNVGSAVEEDTGAVGGTVAVGAAVGKGVSVGVMVPKA